MAAFEAYHGVSADTHQRRVDELARAGYRPVALDVSGDPDDARYAAVWVQRAGPGWWAVHGLNGGDYQTWFDELTGRGYAPVIVSGTGPAGREVYAAVFEQGVSEPWFARHGLRWGSETDPDTLVQVNSHSYNEGYVPRCLSVYGEPEDRRFAGIWVKNTDAVGWSWWWTAPEAYQRFFDALGRGGMRPAAVSVAPDGYALSVYRGDQIGQWWARHGISATEYQVEFDRHRAEGRRPIVVAAGDARYTAVFAADDVPVPRSWQATGASFAGLSELDEAVRRFMTQYGIRAGGVAIGRAGALLGARGYTWAEPGYPVTGPETRFRIASLSKIVTAAAISELVAAGLLSWRTAAFPFVGVTSALPDGVSADPAMKAVTVEELILRTSRLPRDFDREQRDIAAVLGTTAAPLSRDLLVRYLYGSTPVSTVPAGGLYSNTAFFLLTSVVERASGLPFLAAVQRDVLDGMGIDDVAVAATDVRQPGEVIGYDHADVHASQLDYAATALAPNAYGGTTVLENGEGSGGLLASAASIARLIGCYPVWNADSTHLTGREVATRYGTLDGTSAGATCRPDGLDFVFLFNRRVSTAQHDEIRRAINDVLNRHGAGL